MAISGAARAASGLHLDPFRRPTAADQRALRVALGDFFRDRDGPPDFDAGELPEREAFLSAFPVEEPPISFAVPADCAVVARYADRPAPKDLDPRALWSIALSKINRAEAYGVEYELERLSRRGIDEADPLFLHVALEERYHSRLLELACKISCAPFSQHPPPVLLRLLTRAMSRLPDGARFLLALCAESTGASLFELLRARSAAFFDRPDVARRAATLLGEIWRDELAHVAYCRSRVPRGLLPLARALHPLVARTLLWQIPELVHLGGGREATLRHVRRPLTLPAEMAWASDTRIEGPRRPPGPRRTPANAVRLLRGPLRLLPELQRRYGDVVHLGLGDLQLVTHPAGVARVLESEASYAPNERAHRWIRRIAGDRPSREDGAAQGALEDRVGGIVSGALAVRERWESAAAAEIPVDVRAGARRITRSDRPSPSAVERDDSASTLVWALHLLARHPAVRERLAREVRRALGDRPPSAADLPRLAYAEAVVKETLRLYPPAWVVARGARREDILDGWRIPADATVLVSAWVTHRRPDCWPEPDVFDPCRFEPGASADRSPFAWYPFGGLPRADASSAVAGVTLALAVLHQTLRLEAFPGDFPRPLPRRSLEAGGEVRMMPRLELRALRTRQPRSPGTSAWTAPTLGGISA